MVPILTAIIGASVAYLASRRQYQIDMRRLEFEYAQSYDEKQRQRRILCQDLLTELSNYSPPSPPFAATTLFTQRSRERLRKIGIALNVNGLYELHGHLTRLLEIDKRATKWVPWETKEWLDSRNVALKTLEEEIHAYLRSNQ